MFAKPRVGNPRRSHDRAQFKGSRRVRGSVLTLSISAAAFLGLGIAMSGCSCDGSADGGGGGGTTTTSEPGPFGNDGSSSPWFMGSAPRMSNSTGHIELDLKVIGTEEDDDDDSCF